ncbi:MAG: 8-amino-7-oxononanoate synthase, partial [Planctomycetales bacterium]|nr:8-amino-7-oxononanoate synthase [Planctomycetales bacterium]
MPQSWSAFLEHSLQRTAEAQRTRVRRPLDLDGLIDFGSNDYLGLRSHPDVLASLHHASQLAGARWGAGASPVLSGYSAQHASLERALAEFSSTPAAIVFSSGFACHSGSVACLAGAGDLILSDQWNHASLIDGCRLSRASTVIYPHADADFVRSYLQEHRHQFDKVLLLSESIFSMDGDAAPLVSLSEIAERYDTGLVVDEAHAVGVYGQRGGGLLEELHLQSQVLAKLGTLSKALGCVGGYVAGDEKLIDYLVNHCRSYLFSTAAPSLVVLAAQRTLQLLVNMQDERQSLRCTARLLRQRLSDLGLGSSIGDSPIIPVMVGSESRALALSRQLWERGIYVPAIRPPTVPDGTCRLRVSLSNSH